MDNTRSVVLGTILVAVILFAAYFFIFYNRSDDLDSQKAKIQNSLAKAEQKLNKDKKNLDNLTQKLQDSFPLAVHVQGQMKNSFDVVKKTDFMFDNPYGLNPQLIIKDFFNSAELNSQRKEINVLLERWQQELDLLSVQKIDIAESEKIRKDIETIKEFVKNLTEAVKALTPENSGLSQQQIDSYSSSFYLINNIDDILAAIDTSIKDSKINNTPSPREVSDGTSTNTGGTATTQNTNTGDNATIEIPLISNLFTSSVTPEDVIQAQQQVSLSQKQVDLLKDELSQVQEQLNPTPLPIPEEVIPTPTIEDPNNANPGIQRIKYQGIIIQPGPPRLIQGSDPY